MMDDQRQAQLRTCQQFEANFEPCGSQEMIGISQSALDGELPLNGLRHPPEGDSCGWFIWGGAELSKDDDFFKPLHVAHVAELVPEATKFLGLPSGWRFLVASGHVDVWFDPNLLDVD
jgi:hypothetical protein